MTIAPTDPSRGDLDTVGRFSNRVEDYVRCRPGYPADILDVLIRESGLSDGSVVADIGSGTGISSELLLRSGSMVYGVEPNEAMRAAAARWLWSAARFRSVAGTAEATGLAGGSIDLVTAAQSFHWFDIPSARREFTRILRPGGQVALFWNVRDVQASPFLIEYEEMLETYAADYKCVTLLTVSIDRVREMFGGPYASFEFLNEQVFDFDGLRGRLLSSSYAPADGRPDHEPMLERLREIFDRHQVGDRVRMVYRTDLHVGGLDATPSGSA